jgi:ATP/maltotriose-dependent transcriptional regulator MalT
VPRAGYSSRLPSPEELIATGNAALKNERWQAARESFQAALALGESVESLFGLGTASFWVGDMRKTLEYLERAFALARRASQPMYAAASALKLAFHYRQHLANPATAAGWLGRAARIIEDEELVPLRTELLLIRAYLAEDPRAGEVDAREALEIARRNKDVDAELCGLAQLGALLVEQGRTAEGLALLDEAMAGCLGGEAGNAETVVFTNCQTMIACARCADFERALHWVRTAERTADRLGFPFLYAECRTVHARILFATGEWARAEQAAKSVLELCQGQVAAYEAEAIAVLAELRLAQGRIEEGERLLLGFEGYSVTAPALARAHLLRGKPALAAATVQRCLDLAKGASLESAALLELLGEAEIAEHEHDKASERGRALAELGSEVGCRIVAARGWRLQGHALLPAHATTARQKLDLALRDFVRLGMPYEAARTRLLLANAFSGEPELAANEARLALAAFEQLGASGDGNAASALLRQLGVRVARTGPKRFDELTRREQEVLALLGEGLSNPVIAKRLFVSRKTVEHHVAHILDKLGVSSRAEATAEAIRLSRAKPAAK